MSSRCKLQCFDDPRCCYDEPAVTVVADASNEDRKPSANCGARVTARRWNVGSKDILPEADVKTRDPEREQQVGTCDASTTPTPSGPAAQLIDLLKLPGQEATLFHQGDTLVLKLGAPPQRNPSISSKDNKLQALGSWGSPILECESWDLEEDNFRGFEEVGTLEGGVRDLMSLPSRDSETSMWLSLRQGSSSSMDSPTMKPKITFSVGQSENPNTAEEEICIEAFDDQSDDQSRRSFLRRGSALNGSNSSKDAQPLSNHGEQLQKASAEEQIISLENQTQTSQPPFQDLMGVEGSAQETVRTKNLCTEFASF
mmetsp:Transcript_125641/g.250714  ORF Transcript_125641/g.250714 Transcript_125641/m.250714 type:complete len:313 (+) Transcript_125641:71-1009(+)